MESTYSLLWFCVFVAALLTYCEIRSEDNEDWADEDYDND